MSLDATGLWSGWARERISCPKCSARVGAPCTVEEGDDVEHGVHRVRTEAYQDQEAARATLTPRERLREAEADFLRACGWVELDEDDWEEPVVLEGKQKRRVLTFGHAVNSELAYGKARGTLDTGALGCLAHHQVQYLLETGWEPANDEIHGRNAWLQPAPDKPPGWRRRVRHGTKRAVNSQKAIEGTLGHRLAVRDRIDEGPNHARAKDGTPPST